MNHRHRRNLDRRNPRHTHPHPRTNRSRSLHHHRVECHRRDMQLRNPGFYPGAISFEPGQFRLLARRHNLEPPQLNLRGYRNRSCLRQSRRQRTRRTLFRSCDQVCLRNKLISPPGRQGQHRTSVMFHLVCKLMRPSQAAVVITCVESGRHHCRCQPSPCLCFHRLNPFWLNRRTAEPSVSKEYGSKRA
jgi:hypothetical protein